MKFDPVNFGDIWSEVKVVLYLFVESMGRFWANRFHRDNDEILYLRTELEKSRRDLMKLVELLKSPVETETSPVSSESSDPIPLSTHMPWRMKAIQLEKESRARRAEMEATRQSTEELEKELGVANAIQQ